MGWGRQKGWGGRWIRKGAGFDEGDGLGREKGWRGGKRLRSGWVGVISVCVRWAGEGDGFGEGRWAGEAEGFGAGDGLCSNKG